MKSIIFLLFTSTFAFANPTAIHYSDVGNYLVDQEGNRTTIQGHPRIACYKNAGEVEGTFQKSKGSIIWLIADKWNGHGVDNWYVMIKYPVCDLK